MSLFYVSFQSQSLPIEFLPTALDLADVDLLDGVEGSELLGVGVQGHPVRCPNVGGEVRPELELSGAELTDESAKVEPLNPVLVVVNHELVVVVLQGDPVCLGEVLVDGEVVTQDTDTTYLTCMPGPSYTLIVCPQ